MKVIKDTAILTENDEIKSRWKKYCEDWHLIEMVSAVRSKMRRPIRTAVRVAATNKGTKLRKKNKCQNTNTRKLKSSHLNCVPASFTLENITKMNLTYKK